MSLESFSPPASSIVSFFCPGSGLYLDAPDVLEKGHICSQLSKDNIGKAPTLVKDVAGVTFSKF